MTLDQIRESTKETLSVVDVAEALGANPQTIRYFFEYGRPIGG